MTGISLSLSLCLLLSAKFAQGTSFELENETESYDSRFSRRPSPSTVVEPWNEDETSSAGRMVEGRGNRETKTERESDTERRRLPGAISIINVTGIGAHQRWYWRGVTTANLKFPVAVFEADRSMDNYCDYPTNKLAKSWRVYRAGY